MSEVQRSPLTLRNQGTGGLEAPTPVSPPPPSLARHALIQQHSVSLCGRGAVLGVREDGSIYAIPMSCKSWSCPRCRPVKAMRYKRLLAAGKPSRHLTLTVDPALHATPEAALAAMTKAWTRFIATLRAEYGPVEYVRIVEITKRGWPHFHVLLRSGYIPQGRIAALWSSLGAGSIVWIRRVYEREIETAVDYLLKDMVKFFSPTQNAIPGKRIINLSRRWLTPDQKKKLLEADKPDSGVVTWVPVWGATWGQVLADLASAGCTLQGFGAATGSLELSAVRRVSQCSYIDEATLLALTVRGRSRGPPRSTSLDSVGTSHMSRRKKDRDHNQTDIQLVLWDPDVERDRAEPGHRLPLPVVCALLTLALSVGVALPGWLCSVSVLLAAVAQISRLRCGQAQAS